MKRLCAVLLASALIFLLAGCGRVNSPNELSISSIDNTDSADGSTISVPSEESKEQISPKNDQTGLTEILMQYENEWLYYGFFDVNQDGLDDLLIGIPNYYGEDGFTPDLTVLYNISYLYLNNGSSYENVVFPYVSMLCLTTDYVFHGISGTNGGMRETTYDGTYTVSKDKTVNILSLCNGHDQAIYRDGHFVPVSEEDYSDYYSRFMLMDATKDIIMDIAWKPIKEPDQVTN